MAKRRKTKALFELLGGEQGNGAKIGVPDWIKPPKPQPESTDPDATAEATDALPVADEQPTAAPEVATDPAPEPPAVQPPTRPKIIAPPTVDAATIRAAEEKARLADEKVRQAETESAKPATPKPEGPGIVERMKARAERLKAQAPPLPELNSKLIWIGAGGVLVLFIVIMLLVTGGDDPKPGTGDGADRPELKNVAGLPEADKGLVAINGKRVAERNYLIIERVKGDADQDRQDAEHIKLFCERNGLPAQVVRLGRAFGIWSFTGFLDPNGPAAKAYLAKVENVGENYFNAYGKYKFRVKTKAGVPPFGAGGN